MVFSSLSFIFLFLPLFLILYYISPAKLKNILLLSASLIFYGLGEPRFLFVIAWSILINYILSLFIDRYQHKPKLKLLYLILALIYNFGILFFFKYINFFIDNINFLLDFGNINLQINYLNISLPLGISFYTFQIVSYVIDIYCGKIKADKSIINLGTYLCMFPQLIAGPIVVYSDISYSLKSRTISIYKLDIGLKNFIIGLSYKVILANRIGTLWNEICTIGFESISTPLAWLGAVAYSLQLYFDFCGYSLMAIGLGEMLGFNIPVNFKHPYMSRSVTDFWHRWHITLGTWFKEYVYIPLGGNRKGKLRTIFNLFIVWLLVGLWHGAGWNFIIWGLFIFLLQIIEKNLTLKFLTNKNIFCIFFSHIYMIGYILISWIIFAISDFSELLTYLARMFPFFKIGNAINPDDFIKYITTYGLLIIICLIFATGYPEKFFIKIRQRKISIVISLALFWYAVYYLSIGINNPFLYFRF